MLVGSALELEHHGAVRWQAHARAHDILQHGALLGERVDNGRVRRHERRLCHVGQQHSDGVEPVEGLAILPQLDPRDELGEEAQVEYERRCQEAVLARVVHHDGVLAPHEEVTRVLIHGALRVAHVLDVLDHHHVVGVLAGLVEDLVRGDHVVHHVGLGDLLAAEGLRGLKVVPVVVAQVVVRHDRGGLQAGTNKEVNQHGLHLCLATLEVVTTNERVEAHRCFDHAWHECVLRGAIDERNLLVDARQREQGARRDLGLVPLQRRTQVLLCVVQARDEVGVSLRVGRPQHDHLV
mmetsp:Transcript_1473/g.5025  ORF Transcript_1473/g.5025 Transcript_1473/m.5025 type:complete len:294 (-) Transcript_1473:892-1773(-)